MDPNDLINLVSASGIFLVAFLASAGGQSGAPGYLALMVVFGTPSYIQRPAALALAIVVAVVGTIRAFRSGFFNLRTFWPFVVGSVPGVLIAAGLDFRPVFYLVALALVLLYGAIRLFLGFTMMSERKTTVVPIQFAVPLGFGIGLLSGLAGVAGAIFLVSLLLLMSWAKTKEAIAVAAPFALVNAIIGFSFSNPIMAFVSGGLIYWVPAALIGAWIGTEVEIPPFLLIHLNRILSLLLLVAALRLVPAII